MIQGITENNFPDYATLHEATVTLNDMGERIIETQIRIDGDIVPEFGVRRNGTFYPMSLTFKNEVFVLPNKTPTASKDNSTRNSIITLTFRSEVIEDLKRYFFFMPSPSETSTAVAEKYNASVRLTLTNFVAYMNTVLTAYFGTSKYVVRLSSGSDDGIERLVEIDYAKLWDVLTRVYDIFGKRWSFTRDGQTTYIDIGRNAETLDEHVFEYGYDGGLMKFERNTNEDEITNVLLGRGGERNVPRLYFKDYEKFHPGDSSYSNNGFTPDPDALWELENVYFDRIRDLNFRWYVRGWMTNRNRQFGPWTYPHYDESQIPSEYQPAYYKGQSDTNFNPIEYVKDAASITTYGEHWGALEDNDNIYPTIQGMKGPILGDLDELVDAEIIESDDYESAVAAGSIGMTIKSMVISLVGSEISGQYDITSEDFEIPRGKVGLLSARWTSVDNISQGQQTVIDTEHSTLTIESVDGGEDITKDGNEKGFNVKAIPAGRYRLILHLELHAPVGAETIAGTYGLEGITITPTSPRPDGWRQTFDVWVKNIWGTVMEPNETHEQYAERVWLPILRDRDGNGNEAAMVFTSGALSVASDYEFVIAGIPEHDTTKTLAGGIPSEWKITLYKSDAEYEATGKWLPNIYAQARAGDHFFFIGIDIPNTYVLDAERRLHIYKEDALKTMKDVFPTWTITLDKVRVHTLEDDDAGLNKKLADVLSPGMKIKISDPRFTKGDQLTLYIQSIIYRWAEPTKDSPYIVPDIELTLSDKVVSQQSAFSKMQFDVKEIGSSYVREIDVEEIVRKVAGELFLKKTGEADESLSPTKFASSVTSNGFRQGGVGGTGWGLYRTNAAPAPATIQTQAPEGESVIEVDRCIVRKELEVNTLVVNQISSRGGKEILSAASITVTKVIEGETDVRYFDCYFDQKQGSVANLFEVDDIAFSQVFKTNPNEEEEGEEGGGGILLRYYKAVVLEVGIDYIRLDASRWDGEATPQVGDVIVQYGNISKAERQFAIIRDVVGGGYEQMISGLTGGYDEDTGDWYFSPGVEYFFAGKTRGQQAARWFIGRKDESEEDQTVVNGQYIEYANGHLTIMGSASVQGVSGSTEIAGDLIQTGEISLGQRITGDNLTVWAGISGKYDGTALGKGVAAWYGGPKVDHEDNESASSYAKSLFRFDGSGYLAGGNITWDEDGIGHIPGMAWDGSNVIIDNDVQFRSASGSELIGLVDSVRTLSNMFIDDTYTEDGATKHRIKVGPTFTGLYTEGFLTAGGIGQPGGGGGGTSVGWGDSQPGVYANIWIGTETNYKSFSLYGHNHDGRYYKKDEVDVKIQAITPGEMNVQSDWAETNQNSDAYILNKPDLSIYALDSNLSRIAGSVSQLSSDVGLLQDELEHITDDILELKSYFGKDTNGNIYVKNNKGFYSFSFITAGGVGSGSGSEGGGGVDASLVVRPDDATISVGANSATFYLKAKIDSMFASGATTNNVAVFASGGGVADSGIHKSALALLPNDNQFTGNNTFNQAINALAYNTLSGENILRAYTESGGTPSPLLIGYGTCPNRAIQYYAKTSHTFSVYDSSLADPTWNPVLALQNTAIYAYRNIEPGGDATLNLGASSLRWNNLYLKRWYPKQGDTSVYVEYDATTDSFYFHGNIIASGFITAGQSNSNA